MPPKLLAARTRPCHGSGTGRGPHAAYRSFSEVADCTRTSSQVAPARLDCETKEQVFTAKLASMSDQHRRNCQFQWIHSTGSPPPRMTVILTPVRLASCKQEVKYSNIRMRRKKTSTACEASPKAILARRVPHRSQMRVDCVIRQQQCNRSAARRSIRAKGNLLNRLHRRSLQRADRRHRRHRMRSTTSALCKQS